MSERDQTDGTCGLHNISRAAAAERSEVQQIGRPKKQSILPK